MHELNLKGLKFPLIPKDVKKFERQNPTISVNISQWTETQALITRLCVTWPDSFLDALRLVLKHTYVLIVFTVLPMKIC